MKPRFLSIVAASLALSLPVWTFAADGDKPADKPADTAAPANPGQRGGPGRFGGPGAFGNRDPLADAVSALGEANLSPDFTLTKEQKEKIQAIRDDFKKQMDKWKADHEADIKKLQDQVAALRGNAGGGGGGANMREQFQAIGTARTELYASAPKAEDAVKQIKAVLSEDEAKAFDAKEAERQAEAEKARQDMAARFGNRGGQGGGQGPGGARGGRRGGQGGGGNGAGGGAAPGGAGGI